MFLAFIWGFKNFLHLYNTFLKWILLNFFFYIESIVRKLRNFSSWTIRRRNINSDNLIQSNILRGVQCISEVFGMHLAINGTCDNLIVFDEEIPHQRYYVHSTTNWLQINLKFWPKLMTVAVLAVFSSGHDTNLTEGCCLLRDL